MSFYKAANIGLNVLQNVQQFATNTKLQALLNKEQLKADQAEALSSVRDTLFHYSTAFDAASPERAQLPTLFFIALTFQQWVSENNITSGAFDSFADKEFFSKAGRAATSIMTRAHAEMSPQDIQAVEELSRFQGRSLAMAAAEAWIAVRSEMVGGSIVWNGQTGAASGMIGFAIIGIGASFIFGVLLRLAPSDAAGGTAVMMGTPLLIAALLWRKKLAAKLQAKVVPFGGFFSSRARIKEVDIIIQEFEKAAVSPWAKIGPGKNWREASTTLHSRARQEADRLGIPEEYIFA